MRKSILSKDARIDPGTLREEIFIYGSFLGSFPEFFRIEYI